MIKENQKLLNRIQVVLDAGVIIVAYVLSCAEVASVFGADYLTWIHGICH